MQTPDFTRMIETFIIFIDDQNQPANWSDYMQAVRSKVLPVIRNLERNHLIDWYSFLLHGASSGVPNQSAGLYFHVRVCHSPNRIPADVINALPSTCEMTQMMSRPNSLDRVELSTLSPPNLENGYKLLGELSEWVLSFVEAHLPNQAFAPESGAQYLHYFGNMLQSGLFGRPL